MPTINDIGYIGQSKLMPNYGWVQDSSNLSTVRDTVQLIPDDGISHNDLMRAIGISKLQAGKLTDRWDWEARCRIKAACACGLTRLDRRNAGYVLTDIGRELKNAPISDLPGRRGIRKLTEEEREIYQRGLLTNPPVIRVLSLLNYSRRNLREPLSKYDIGRQLGFVGDTGFTHLEPEYIVENNWSFNDKEGDADKWARTIISWLIQVQWVVEGQSVQINGKKLLRYTTTDDVDQVLRYAAKRTTKYIPQEMLCSGRYAFPRIVQKRRMAILEALNSNREIQLLALLGLLVGQGIEIDEELLKFELINLKQAGIDIQNEGSVYRLMDRVELDVDKIENANVTVEDQRHAIQTEADIERAIEQNVVAYAQTLPAGIVTNLIRYGLGGKETSTMFEATVSRFFEQIGYSSEHLGQGRGRVADVIAKYYGTPLPRSYGLIIDAKAYECYDFPVGDVRKMKEYINHHINELMEDHIPNAAFAFVSMDYSNPDAHLQEIANETLVNGTAITVDELLKFGDQVMQRKLKIEDAYPKFTTNKLFSII